MAIKNQSFVFTLLCFLFFLKVGAQQKSQKDSLETWFSHFGAFRIEGQSPSGQYIALKKTTNRNTDTMMIFDRRRKTGAILKIPGAKTADFLEDKKVLAFGAGRVEVWNLINLNKSIYPDVKRADLLKKHQQYSLLDQQQTLHIFTDKGIRLEEFKNAKNYVTDNKGVLYVEKQGKSGIWKWDKNEMIQVYKNTHEIERMELGRSSASLVIFEKKNDSALRRVVVFNGDTGSLHYPLGQKFIKQDYFNYKEIAENGDAIITGVLSEKYDKAPAEIWYGNDRDVKSRQYGKIPHEKYWIWEKQKTTATALRFSDNTTVSPMGNARYFIFFNRDELRDYTRSRPPLNIHLYDRETDENLFLGKTEPEIYTSNSGKYILYRRNENGWEILCTLTKKIWKIQGKSLSKPVFSADNEFIYFETTNDLWCYSIKEKRLFPLLVAPGKNTRIINQNRVSLCIGFPIFRTTADNTMPLLLEAYDPRTKETSYLSLLKNKMIRTVVKTANRISFFTMNPDENAFTWVEENYHLAPQLNTADQKGILKTLFRADETDKNAAKIKQEIISYSLENGQQLKGILYYPQNFNLSNKYPMVVNVYQIQHHLSTDYLLPQYDGIGFNIRTLIEKGYFVYLPDTVADTRGPGISGVECVNKALDAIMNNENIDFSKVGLTGHSFGGYLTNFIATRSTRFAAYIGGSGMSDMVSSYFSFNYNFTGPYSWQFETGIYQMEKSFANDKEKYYQNSPVLHVENVSAPVLLWTGKLDENVIPENTMAFYNGLRRNRKKVIALHYPKSGHSLTSDSSEMKDLNIRVLEWWDYFLKNKRNAFWINREMEKDAG